MMKKLRGFEYPMAMKRALRPVVRRVRYLGLQREDALIASYPRSGSTWLRFILTEILAGASEWDAVNEIVPYAGEHRGAPKLLAHGGRLVKTHELTSGPCHRAVYLARDPRDVVLSEHRLSLRGGSTSSVAEYIPRWVDGRESPFGRWDVHVDTWLDGTLARRGDLLVIRFEDLKADTPDTVKTILEFLGAVGDRSAIEDAIEANTLARMREKEDRAPSQDVKRHDGTHRFVGEGAASGWRGRLTPQEAMIVSVAERAAMSRLGYEMPEPVRP